MKYRYLGLFVILLFAVTLASCGSGGQSGSPGSHGSTGVKLSALVIPQNDKKDTSDVDAFPNICPDGKAEKFFRHGAEITISATLESPDIAVQPGTIFIEEYTIDYVRSDDSVGAPPIEQYHEFTSIEVPVPTVGSTGSTTVTFSGMFVDIPRKLKYVDDLGFVFNGLDWTLGPGQQFTSTSTLNNYTAIFTFFGKNEYGDSFSFQASAPFVIGDFNNCGG